MVTTMLLGLGLEMENCWEPEPEQACGGRERASTPAAASREFEPVAQDRRSEPAGRLERMVRMVRSNERLMSERRVLVAKIASVRDYLAAAGSNAALGTAQLRRLKTKYSGVLAQLRANRIEARQLLGFDPIAKAGKRDAARR